jgi:hypothetical protein
MSLIGDLSQSWPQDSLANSLGRNALSLQLAQQLLATHGVHLITKLRKKLHNRLLDWTVKLLLRRRAIIEAINDQL